MNRDRFKSIGKDVTIYPMAKIVGAEMIEIGSHVIIDDFVFIQATAPIYIGNYVHIASFVSIGGGGVLSMEDFSGLSSGVRVFTGSDDFKGNSLTNPTIPPSFRSVQRSWVDIKAHAIIGANTVILPGVTIGTGAALGACSLARKNLKPWTVYSGNPPKALGVRPPDKILQNEQDLYQKYGKPEKCFRDMIK
ncbi:MAG: acyltransferase [Nitrospiria bacterium]